MSCVTKVPVGTDLERPAGNRFGGRSKLPKGVPEVVARQARLTLLSFQAHDHRDQALAFLNTHSDELQGRPIDVAGETDAGLAAASSLLASARAG